MGLDGGRLSGIPNSSSLTSEEELFDEGFGELGGEGDGSGNEDCVDCGGVRAGGGDGDCGAVRNCGGEGGW